MHVLPKRDKIKASNKYIIAILQCFSILSYNDNNHSIYQHYLLRSAIE
jgi:hypothetical protein